MLCRSSHSDWKHAVCILRAFSLYLTGLTPFTKRGVQVSSGDLWQCLEKFLVITTGCCYWHIEDRRRSAAKYPAKHRTAPPTKNYPSQNVNCVAVEKPCSSPTVLSEGKIGRFKRLMIVQSVTSGSRVIFKPGLLIYQIKQVIDLALFPFFHCGCCQKAKLIGC